MRRPRPARCSSSGPNRANQSARSHLASELAAHVATLRASPTSGSFGAKRVGVHVVLKTFVDRQPSSARSAVKFVVECHLRSRFSRPHSAREGVHCVLVSDATSAAVALSAGCGLTRKGAEIMRSETNAWRRNCLSPKRVACSKLAGFGLVDGGVPPIA